MRRIANSQQLRKALENRRIRHEWKKFHERANNLTGYPEYPPEEDIYKKYREEIELNPENPIESKISSTGHFAGYTDNVKYPGKDLDIPGAELDDEQELIGNEDEENNYYSLGGDNHENLEETRDDTAP